MTLIERFKAKETKTGQFFKTWVTGFLLVCSILGGGNAYLSIVPQDWIPLWLKTTIVVAGIISYVGGKLTVDKTKQDAKV